MAQQLSPEDQQKLNKLIEEGKKLAKQLGDELSSASLDNITTDLNTAERLVQSLRDEWKEYTSDIAGAREGFTRIVDEIKNINSGTKIASSSFKDLASLAQKLQSHQEGINKLSSKEILNLKKQVTERTNDLKLAGKLAKDQIRTLESKGNLSRKEQRQLKEARIAHENISQEITQNIGFIKQFSTQLGESARKAKNMEDALGLAGNATKAISTGLKGLGLGSLADKLGLDEAQAKMEEMADKITEGGENAATMGNKFKVMGAGVKSMASSLGKNLLDPAVLVTQFAEALKATDSGAGDMAKKMNMTYGEALNTRKELGSIAALSGDVSLNTKNLQETYMAVGQSLGTNAKLNDKDLTTMTKLVSQAGFQHDELMEIQKLSLSQNKSLEANTSEILGGAKAYASRKKIVVNEKDVLREVNKMSASLKLSLGGSASAMAEAVVKTKEFGLNLEQASKMSESLLDFESSIENELSAELLTGKNLNFETARQLAMNNDIAGAAEEIAKQVGTSADFAKMNALQQESIAKAAGLTKDELAQSLIDKEALTKIGFKDAEAAKAKYETLRKTMTAEQAAKALGDETLAGQYEQQSVQERFAQATEKLKEIFIQIAEPVMAIVSPLMNLVGSVLPMVNVLLQPIVFAFQTIGSTLSTIFTWLSESKGVLAAILGTATLLGVAMNYSAISAGVIAAKEQLILTFQGKGLIIEQGKAAIQAVQLGYKAAMGSMDARAALLEKKGLVRSIGEAAMKVVAGFASMGPLGFILGLAAAGTVAALGYKYMNDGVISPSSGGGGYGDRVLYGPEGAISFNNKDTIVAGTNLFSKGDDVMSGPKGSITVANSTASAPAKPDSNEMLASEMKRGNDLREQQMRKDRTVSTLKIQ
jgi:hypothetical protein